MTKLMIGFSATAVILTAALQINCWPMPFWKCQRAEAVSWVSYHHQQVPLSFEYPATFRVTNESFYSLDDGQNGPLAFDIRLADYEGRALSIGNFPIGLEDDKKSTIPPLTIGLASDHTMLREVFLHQGDKNTYRVWAEPVDLRNSKNAFWVLTGTFPAAEATEFLEYYDGILSTIRISD